MSIAFTAVPKNFDVQHLILNRHQRLFDEGLSEVYFDIVMDHFVGTLEEMNIDKDVIDEAARVIRPLRAIFVQGAEEARQRRKATEEHQVLVSCITAAVVAGIILFVFSTARRSSSKR